MACDRFIAYLLLISCLVQTPCGVFTSISLKAQSQIVSTWTAWWCHVQVSNHKCRWQISRLKPLILLSYTSFKQKQSKPTSVFTVQFCYLSNMLLMIFALCCPKLFMRLCHLNDESNDEWSNFSYLFFQLAPEFRIIYFGMFFLRQRPRLPPNYLRHVIPTFYIKTWQCIDGQKWIYYTIDWQKNLLLAQWRSMFNHKIKWIFDLK